MPTSYRFARQTCTTKVDGASVHLSAGDAWPADDPAVLAHPGLFTDEPPIVRRTKGGVTVAERNDPPVERATAEPGEKRTVRPRASKKS